jgi:hypothetical protein
MRDAIGNTIKVGDVVLMRSHGFIFKVLRVELPTDKDWGPKDPSKLVLEMVVPVDRSNIKSGEEPQLADIYRVVDPRSEKILDQMLTEGQVVS